MKDLKNLIHKNTFFLSSIVFLAAFLLFQIELIIAKCLLPKFGGGFSVWGAAMVFFQGTLLLGYLYSHFVIQKIGLSRYRMYHLMLVLAVLIFFPGRALPAIESQTHLPMVLSVFWQLLHSIGPVFFVLSTTSIIFQSWLAQSDLPERNNPYALYAVSNLGSFAGLLTYPLFFEIYYDLNIQLTIWRVSYLVLIALHLVVFKTIPVIEESREKATPPTNILTQDKFYWFLLSAAGVIMFTSVTNIITYQVAPIPLLWIAPLCLYLISFILNFKKNPWCPKWIHEKVHVWTAMCVVLYFITYRMMLPFILAIAFHLILLFIICMFCLNRIHESKPSDSRNLTVFYLIISCGGFAGSVLTSWIIPLISTSMLEYITALFMISLALWIRDKKAKIDGIDLALWAGAILTLVVWPLIFKKYNIFGIALIVLIFRYLFNQMKNRPTVFCLSLLSILILSNWIDPLWSGYKKFIYQHRNYYGIYKLYEQNEKRYLINGTTIHGAQYVVKDRQREAIAYYHASTPIGNLMLSKMFNFQSIGIIGLGTGGLVAYQKPGQSIDYFELDPKVFDIADKYFTYLKNALGKIRHIFGDARISLKDIPNERYDLLIVDAFSSDSIPVHLLTVEAIAEYRRCVTDKGIIVFHISNRYLDLSPVLFANASAAHLHACIKENYAPNNESICSSSWMALVGDNKTFDSLTTKLGWKQSSGKTDKALRPWTDQYYNLLSIFNVKELLSQIRQFQPFDWGLGLPDTFVEANYYMTQGATYFTRGDYQRSVEYYQKAAGMGYNMADDYYHNLGGAYYNLGQYEKAIAIYQKGIKARPERDDFYSDIADAYARMERYDKAISYYQKAIELSPDKHAYYYTLGNIYLRNAQQAEALVATRKALELNHNAYNYRVAYDSLLKLIEDEKTLKSSPKDTDLQLKVAQIYQKFECFAQAIQHYQKVIELIPDNQIAYKEVGEMYYEMKKFQEAQSYYQKITQQSASDVDAWRQLGNVYLNLKRYKEAESAYKQTIQLNPRDEKAYANLGAVYLLVGDSVNAKEYLMKARQLCLDSNDEAGAQEVDQVLSKINNSQPN